MPSWPAWLGKKKKQQQVSAPDDEFAYLYNPSGRRFPAEDKDDDSDDDDNSEVKRYPEQWRLRPGQAGFNSYVVELLSPMDACMRAGPTHW